MRNCTSFFQLHNSLHWNLFKQCAGALPTIQKAETTLQQNKALLNNLAKLQNYLADEMSVMPSFEPIG